MKITFFTICALMGCSFLVSCASSPEELQSRMDKKEGRFNKRQEMWDIRAESFDRRVNQMSSNADQRYERSFSKLSGAEAPSGW
jgi:hypothetical protein